MSKRRREQLYESSWSDLEENHRLMKKLSAELRQNAMEQAAAAAPPVLMEQEVPAPTRKPIAPQRSTSKPVVRVVTPQTRNDELMIVDSATSVDLATGDTYKRVSSELKALDTVDPFGGSSTSTWSFIDPPTVFTPLNNVTIGSAAWNRTTRQICMKSLHINGLFHQRLVPDPSPFTAQQCKMMVFYDRQCNGALPQPSEVWLSQINTAFDCNVSNSYSYDNLNSEGRFIFLWHKYINLPGAKPSGGQGPLNGLIRDLSSENPAVKGRTFEINEFIDLGGLLTTYRADSTPVGSIGDISTGSLLFVTWGDGESDTSKWVFSGSLRLRFYDC